MIDIEMVKASTISKNIEICCWIFQQLMTIDIDLQSICEIAMATYQHKYIPLVIQKSFDNQNTHIVGLFVIVKNDNHKEYKKYMTESPYYEELVLFSSIKKRQDCCEHTDEYGQVINNAKKQLI